MRLTGAREVVLGMCLGALAQTVLLWVLTATGRFAAVTPWSLPGLLLIAATALFLHARSVKRRVAERSLAGVQAVRALALGRAAIAVGSLFGGAHLLYTLWFLPRISATQPLARVLAGGVTTVACALLVAAGLRLERACVDPDHGTDDDTPQV